MGSEPDNVTTRANREIWDENAQYWDAHMGDGNDFQLKLVSPATEKLLRLQPGEAILDVGCGNWVVSRRLAAVGAKVTAIDFSPAMIDLARKRGTPQGPEMDYQVVDATDTEALLALGAGRFDAAVSSMALMDMNEIQPLMDAIPVLLKPGGRFVFSVCHPCFNNSAAVRVAEEWDDAEFHQQYSVKVSRYLSSYAATGLALVGQPRPQFYFNRPLSDLLGSVFTGGMVIDGFEERGFDGTDEQPDCATSMRRFSEIPFALIVRCRTKSG